MTVEQARIVNVADDALLAAAYAGDEAAFEQLFLRHYRRVYLTAVRIVGNPEDAEEIALDAFLKLHERRVEVGESSQITGWLYRTATNAAFNVLRSRRRRLDWLRRFASRERFPTRDVENPAQTVEREEMSRMVREALKKLPERQRSALMLRSAGLSYREVALAIDVKPTSVGTILARAEARLRDEVEREGGL